MSDEPARKGVCRCEATIAASILEGYACGNADCWRTAQVRASFDAFVEALVAVRDVAARDRAQQSERDG